MRNKCCGTGIEEVMIDLRSDTLTMPDEAMLKAICSAPLGDDVFGEDPTVNELEEYVSELLGKEAALFTPSGTMANQCALAALTDTGDEFIVEQDAHIYYYETAGPAIISRIQPKPIPSVFGEIDVEKIEKAIRPDIYYFPKTSLISLENTHNRHGGTVLSIEYIDKIGKFARDKGLKLHCDGARIWNACAATGIKPDRYCAPFDTVSACFSKGLGAPCGSILAGSKEIIEKALKIRKILGGGLRQGGILGGACLYAIKNNFRRLADDHENARQFAKIIAESEYIDINIDLVHTDIVMFEIPETLDPMSFEAECRNSGVSIIPFGERKIRACFYKGIDINMVKEASKIIIDVLHKLMK